MFQKNFNYIVNQLGELRGKKYSLQDLATLFNLKRHTIHKWLVGKTKNPSDYHLENILLTIRKLLGWKITPEILLNEDLSISEVYSIYDMKSDQEENLKEKYKNNLLNTKQISRRIKNLRKIKGWTYEDVERKIKELFSDKQTKKNYHISSKHLWDIENGSLVDFYVIKLSALATIYGVNLEYVILGKKEPKPFKAYIDRRNNCVQISISKKLITKFTDEQLINHQKEKLESIILTYKTMDGLI